MDNLLDLLQWPAMLATVVAAWWVASTQARKRVFGFWTFLVSNALWVAWGWHTQATALVVLQFCLAAMNIRGFLKARHASEGDGAATAESSPVMAPTTCAAAAHPPRRAGGSG